jgi:hypothetical protein
MNSRKSKKAMGKLNLPIIKGPAAGNPKCLSMDEYLEFVNFNLKFMPDREASRRWKKTLFVNTPFVLR